MSDLTRNLCQIKSGDPKAADQLLPLVYDELRKLAGAKLSLEKPGQTMQATALVHEAYLRLAGTDAPSAWSHRGHFLAAAAQAMRRILIENARRKKRIRHGGEFERADVDLSGIVCEVPDENLLALDAALARLACDDPQKARLVELRFFAGLSNEEAAATLGISSATAKRHWRYARAWLHKEIGGLKLPEAADSLESTQNS